MNALIHLYCCVKWQIHLSYEVLNTVTMLFALIELSTLIFNFIKIIMPDCFWTSLSREQALDQVGTQLELS